MKTQIPVKEWLYAHAVGPDVVVEVKIVSVTMAWINLYKRRKKIELDKRLCFMRNITLWNFHETLNDGISYSILFFKESCVDFFKNLWNSFWSHEQCFEKCLFN